MIPNQWYVILESNEVKRGKPVGVTRLSEKLVAWRDARGQVTVMRDLCPHRGVALSAGKLIRDCIECPFHGFRYDTTGACKLVPANGRSAAPPKALRAHTYSTSEAHGFIYIWWGEPKNDLPPLPWFDNIAEGEFSTQTLRDHWTAHYSRAIVNQLDVAHLPFVHQTTIGRGNQTLVNGPVSRAPSPQRRPDGYLVRQRSGSRTAAPPSQRDARTDAASFAAIPISESLAKLAGRCFAHRHRVCAD
jgi:phenylpropionate dioxygenase-like ring-hydroxylating dioxygenase large terminal subunit